MRDRRPLRQALATPLARFGFTALAVLAAVTGQLIPALTVGLLAALAWKARP